MTEQEVIDAYTQSLRRDDESNNADNRESSFENGVRLEASDIVVRKFNINMGMKQRNPLECVSFYREVDGIYQRVQKQPKDISMMMAEKC